MSTGDEVDDSGALVNATRDELLDHIHLQRKLIKRLYRRIVELEQNAAPPHQQQHDRRDVTSPVPTSTSRTPTAAQHSLPQRLSSPVLREDLPPQRRDASQLITPSPSQYQLPTDTSRQSASGPYIFPTSFHYAPPIPSAQHAPPAHVGQRVVSEIARIDAILMAHEQASEGVGGTTNQDAILGEEAVLDLHSMRDKLAVVLRTPYPMHAPQYPLHARTMSFSPSNVAADAALEDLHSKGALFRGMSAHTAPREKATAEDVLACAQWAVDTPLSSRTSTPFVLSGAVVPTSTPMPLRHHEASKDAPLVPELLDVHQERARAPAAAHERTHITATPSAPPMQLFGGGRATPPRLLVERIQHQLHGSQSGGGWSTPARRSPRRDAHYVGSPRSPLRHGERPQSSPWRHTTPTPHDCKKLLVYRQRQRAE